MSASSRIPWQAKVAIKFMLARAPIGYRLWRRIGIFRHGAMREPGYAYDVFRQHFNRAFPNGARPGLVGLELGPGDSLFSALIAKGLGFRKTYLVDSGDFAARDASSYRGMRDFLRKKGIGVDLSDDIGDLDALLRAVDAEYLTHGLTSLRQLPTGSIDFVWSQAVLEHIRLADFLPTMRELRRVLSPTGIASHRVDLMDHLGGALNNLRFSHRVWESDAMAKSGFYTNRIRYSPMLSMFRDAGFDPQVVQKDCWESLPTPTARMAAPYRALPPEELRVQGFDVVLRPR